MEFVVEVLELIFGMDRPKATRIMLEVHTQGKGVCGIYTYRNRRDESGAGQRVCRSASTSPAVYARGDSRENSRRKRIRREMLSSELEFCLNEAFQQARSERHEYMTVEHLLLAILDIPKVTEILKACGADITRLRKELSRIHRGIDAPPDDRRRPGGPADARLPARPAARGVSCPVERQKRSPRRKRARGDLRRKAVARGLPARVARHLAARRRQLYFPRPEQERGSSPARRAAPVPAARGGRRRSHREPAGEFRDEPEPARGRRQDGSADRPCEAEIERTVQILCRRRKNNPLFVGEAGVGKTAMAEGLAKMIVDGEVPDVLRKTRRSMRWTWVRLLAGTKYRGDFEKRFKGVIAELQKRQPGRDPLHRRDSHRHRRRRGLRRRAGRVQPDQAGSRRRRAALYRFHDVSRNTAVSSRRTTRWRGAFRRSTSSSRPSDETVEILKGLRSRNSRSITIRSSYTQTMRCKSAAELAARTSDRSAAAGQGHRRDRRGRRQRATRPVARIRKSPLIDVVD